MKIILAVTIASSTLAAFVADSLPEVALAPATPDIIIASPTRTLPTALCNTVGLGASGATNRAASTVTLAQWKAADLAFDPVAEGKGKQ